MSTSWAIGSSLLVLSAVSLVLALVVLDRYRRERRVSLLYWGIGLLAAFVTIAQECALFVGVWSVPFAQSYLVLTAVLVGILSLGTAELVFRAWKKVAWIVYVAASCVVVTVVGFAFPVGPSIVADGVVTGAPPLATTIASSVVTVPSALLLILGSLYGALRLKRASLLYITFGAIVFSVAGSLYIVSIPVTLYYADFLGTVLFFLGFVRVPFPSSRAIHPTTS